MSVQVSLNPGFVLLLGAALVLVLPRAARLWVSLAASASALYLLFAPDFGEHSTFEQIGLTLVPLKLDPLSQTFGLLFGLIGALLSFHGADGRERAEEAAILAHLGGATTAAFAGDFVSFIAASELSMLAGAALLLLRTDRGAQQAGLSMLAWQAVGGIALLAGAAFIIADAASAFIARQDLASPAGVLFALGLAVKMGVPIAHTWLKEAPAHASTAGAAALLTVSPALGVYAALRLFSGEPALIAAGLGAALWAVPFALASNNLFRTLGYGAVAQAGIALGAAGVGSPIAYDGATAHIFAASLGIALLALALGEARDRAGSAEASGLGGLARSLPLSAAAATLAGLSLAGAPLTLGYAALALVFDGAGLGAGVAVQLAIVAAAGAAAAHTAIKIPWAAFWTPRRATPLETSVFSAAQLSMVAASVLLLSAGLFPRWLYGFLPSSPLALDPFAGDRLVLAVEAGGAAALTLLTAAVLRVFPARSRPLRDIDALLQGPGARALSWSVAAILHAQASWRAGERAVAGPMARGLGALVRRIERPSRPLRLEALFFLLLLAAVLLIARCYPAA